MALRVEQEEEKWSWKVQKVSIVVQFVVHEKNDLAFQCVGEDMELECAVKSRDSEW